MDCLSQISTGDQRVTWLGTHAVFIATSFGAHGIKWSSHQRRTCSATSSQLAGSWNQHNGLVANTTTGDVRPESVIRPPGLAMWWH